MFVLRVQVHRIQVQWVVIRRLVVIQWLGDFQLFEQIDCDGDEIGVGDDAFEFTASNYRQTTDTMLFQKQRGLAQVGLLIDGRETCDHYVFYANVAGMNSFFVRTQI